MEINKQPIYPVEPWTVTETEFKMETNYRNETTFSLSNVRLSLPDLLSWQTRERHLPK